jgi:hypothetical protein
MLALNDRQSHLEAMGVHQWYARTKLAGAQSTPDWALLDPAIDERPKQEVSLESVPRSAESLPEAVQARSAKDILGGLRSPETKQPRALESTSNECPVDTSVVEVRNIPEMAGERALESFTLVLYKANQGIVISESVTGQSHPSELILLKNILKSKPALFEVNKDCQYQQQFNWPVFRSLNLQSKQEKALPSVLASWFMSHYHEGVKSVLYFGSVFPDIKQYYAELISTENKGISFNSFEHSLAELIQFPQRKASIWSDICSLYG